MLSDKLISRFIRTLEELDGVPGLIMSTPGIGKTSVIELYCKIRNINLTTLIASQYSSDDLLGLQSVIDGKLVRLTPAWYDDMIERAKNGNRSLLFIDEYTTCDDFLQAPLLNLIFNKSLGLHKLPKDTIIIAAGNYSEDLNGVFNLNAPSVNRFLILNLNQSMIDPMELLDDSWSKLVKEPAEVIQDYLGLTKVDNNVPQSTIDSIIKSILSNIDLSNINITNSRESGLVGFASIRSAMYSINYFKAFVKLFGLSRELVPVISDSLGRVGKNSISLTEILLSRIYRNPDVRSIKIDQASELTKLPNSEFIKEVRKYTKSPELVTESILRVITDRSSDLPKGIYDEFLVSISSYLTR